MLQAQARAAAPPSPASFDVAKTRQATTSTSTLAPARIYASEPASAAAAGEGTFTQAVLHADLGERLSLAGAQADAVLGNAVHGFLGAAPAAGGDPGQLARIAQRFIDRYLPGDVCLRSTGGLSSICSTGIQGQALSMNGRSV